MISEPFLRDATFGRSVILLVDHTEEGTMGLVINKQLPLLLNDVVTEFKYLDEIPLYKGGPVATDTLFYLHTLEKIPGSIPVSKGLFLNGDFEEIKKSEPKWFQGYSDNTVLTFELPLLADTACIYGPTIKDFGMRNLHRSLEDSLKVMEGNEITQESYEECESREWTERTDPYEEYDLAEKVEWKNLNGEKEIAFKGRAIGGCFDVIANLIGTKYDKVKEFIEKYKNDGIVWFLEVFEMSTPQIYLHLWQMKNAGYFEHCNGIIFGRPLMTREDYGISYEETLKDALGDLNIPVIFDSDIGHVSPQMSIVSGGIIEVTSKAGKGTIKNYFE